MRIGLVLPGLSAYGWQAECVENLLAIHDAEISVWVEGVHLPPPACRGGRAAPCAGFWDLDARSLLWRLASTPTASDVPGALRRVELSRQLRGVSHLRCQVRSHPDGSVSLDGPDAGKIMDLALDVLLDLTFGDLRGSVLDSCTEGVWAFRHGSPSAAGPPGAEEILRGVQVLESALVRLERGGMGRVLHRGWSPVTPDSLSQTRDACLSSVAAWPAREVRRLIEVRRLALACRGTGGSAGTGPARGTTTERLPPRSWRPLSRPAAARFVARVWRSRARTLWTSLFRHQQWNIGLVDAPVHHLIDGAPLRVRWLPDPPVGTFLADPFGVQDGQTLHILAEAFDSRSARGTIAALSVAEDGLVRERRPDVLPSRGHTSYPHLMTVDGETYCVPERSAAREVRLFRCREAPHVWEDLGALIEDLAVADATLCRHAGLWWLFGVDVDHQPEAHLYVWWARELLGRWHPHLLNPVKSDPRSARPAGPIVRRGSELYRPAQDCSSSYGGAVAWNHIVKLSPTEFEEEVVRVLRPDPRGRYPNGLHTVTGVGDITLVDGRRDTFVPREFRRALSRRLTSRVGARSR